MRDSSQPPGDAAGVARLRAADPAATSGTLTLDRILLVG